MSITGDPRRLVVFPLTDHFEYGGVADDEQYVIPYVAWRDGESVIDIHLDAAYRTHDDLLLRLLREKPNAASWLVYHQPKLSDPKSTIVALARVGIISCAEVVDTPGGPVIVVYHDPLHGSERTEGLLFFYGWICRIQDSGHFSHFTFNG